MEFYETLSPEQTAQLDAVFNLAKTCDYETRHTHQVAHLALRIFDELHKLHGLGSEERFLLLSAGILHDIGWVEGREKHHKVSLRIILSTPLLPFESKDRLMIASIARYHRKALPDLRHDHYAALDESERQVVRVLAACLRQADGLDRSHQARVQELDCRISLRKITVRCLASLPADEEEQAAVEKSDLLAEVFQRKVIIHWKPVIADMDNPNIEEDSANARNNPNPPAAVSQ